MKHSTVLIGKTIPQFFLTCDVLLLSDVFEHFRKTLMNHYRFDPANYLAAPLLAWDAMLLHTRAKLDLISNADLLLMIEKMKRGGFCFGGNKRVVKANIKYMPDYDKNEESNYIIYEDTKNLYGCSMSEVLPKWSNFNL